VHKKVVYLYIFIKTLLAALACLNTALAFSMGEVTATMLRVVKWYLLPLVQGYRLS